MLLTCTGVYNGHAGVRESCRLLQESLSDAYYHARISVRLEGEAVHYQSTRVHKRAEPAEFRASYRPIAKAYHAAPGTLDYWLTERYCLYGSTRPGRVVYGEIHHPPWPLQPAEAEARVNTMTRPLGIELPDTRPIAHFARYQAVVAWPIVPLNRK